jgi:hypothetical protein
MPVPPIARADGVVWRIAGDRVLVRWVGTRGEGAARELLGTTALAWATLDQPHTSPQLAAALEVDEASIGDAVGALLEAGLVVVPGP